MCINAFIGGGEDCHWEIASFHRDACSLIKNFNSCVFIGSVEKLMV